MYNSFLKPWRNYLPLFCHPDENTKSKSIFMTFQWTNINDLIWHHVNSFMWQINWSTSFYYLLSIYPIFKCCYIRNMNSHFICLIINELKRKSIFNINWIWRVNRKNHLFKSFMVSNRQFLYFITLKRVYF